MFFKTWVKRGLGIMNEKRGRGRKPFVDRYVTKGWKSATMDTEDGGNAWGNIFDAAYSLVAADAERNIRYNRRRGWARVETSEKSSEANDE